MRYPNKPAVSGHRDTSKAAADAMETGAVAIRNKVLRLLWTGCFTADEAAARLGIDKLAVRPRFSELAKMNLIADSNLRRKNESGKQAIVWRIK